MKPFASYIPTRLYFGAGETQRLGVQTARIGKKVLLVSGQESARRSGLLDKAAGLLRAEGLEVLEFPGVQPNPRLGPCLQAAELCRQRGIEVIVAVGGGSVLDAAKTIAAAALEGGDIWEVFLGRREVGRALPLVTLVTLAATGSELNPHSVILNEKTGQKFSLHSEHVYPRVSILDPQLTLEVPREPTVYGAIDIMAHVLEGYITAEGACSLSDRTVEGLCKVVMSCTERVLEEPRDLEARSELMWCSTIACSGYAGAGYGPRYYDGHQIGHELSATYDLAHGATLSGLLPGVMGFHLAKHASKLAQFARRVFHVRGSWGESEEDVARKGIALFRSWCARAGAPVSLRQMGVRRQDLEAVAGRVLANPEARNLSEADVRLILLASFE
jgi:hypothetical protein